MFKLFKNLLPAESDPNSDLGSVTSESGTTSSWQTQIAQADALWEQGKLSEALAIYGLAIEANPNLLEIRQHLAGRLKQQGDLATAYEKLATGLKNQGKIEQAADYYRQAIQIKAVTGNTKEQLLRSSITASPRTPIPMTSLKETAFSFQPLVSANAQLVKTRPAVQSWSEAGLDSDSLAPAFGPRLRAINPQQAKDIDWETAQVYLQKALDHLEKEEWEQSALACQQATKILPDMAEAYKIWGNALQRMGNTSEAMACYAKAVEIKPNLAEVYAGLADIYGQQDKLQQAVKHYQKAIIIKPTSEIYRKLAEVWERLGDSEQAQLNIQKALELETASDKLSSNSLVPEAIIPEDSQSVRSVEIYCKMARELEAQQEWKQAAKYYRKALDISMALPALPASQVSSKAARTSNTSQESQSKVAIVKKHSPQAITPETQLDKAIKRYYKQSKLQPNSPKIHTDLGNLYTRKGKWQYAIACYRKAIDLKPQYAKAHLNLARALFKVGRQQEFIKEMGLALSLQPKIGSALDRFYLGNTLVDRGQYQQAIGFYYKAIVLNPKFIPAYHRMSEVLSKQGKHQQAVEFLQQGIEQNYQEAESFYLLGQQFEFMQNWDSAVRTYSKVLQLEPQFPGASQKLNHALAEKLKSNYR